MIELLKDEHMQELKSEKRTEDDEQVIYINQIHQLIPRVVTILSLYHTHKYHEKPMQYHVCLLNYLSAPM